MSPTILIVDDEPTTRTYIKELLALQNFTVAMAPSGEDALIYLEENPDVDLILLDIMMPGLNGFEVLEIIKINPQTAQTKVIMFSAANDVSGKVKAFSAGAADYVGKPFEKEELIARIKTQISLQQAEKALRNSEAQYRNLFNRVPLGLYRCTPMGKILDVNKALVQMLGYPNIETLLQVNAADLYVNADSLEAWLSTMAQEQVVRSYESEFYCYDKRIIWIQNSSRCVYDDNNQLQYYEGTLEDITTRKSTEVEMAAAYQAASAAAQAKSDFLANMSHEIRTPLNAIIGMTNFLTETKLDAQQQGYANIINTSGNNLLGIISDILDVSKIDAGKLQLETAPFDLHQCIEEAIDLIATNAGDKGLDVVYELQPDLPNLFVGDITRLRQVLVNLLSNAVKFTEHGEIVVSVTGTQSTKAANIYNLRLTVIDTGLGIPKSRQEHLFEAFNQADASTSRRYGGTGLGLTISKNLIDLMGGRIWIESEGFLDKGSAFYIDIPMTMAANQPQQKMPEISPLLANKVVLIIDDNTASQKYLAHQIAAQGLKPITVSSTTEAIALLNKGVVIDLILLDAHLPQSDNQQFALHLQDRPKTNNIPLILLRLVGQQPPSLTSLKATSSLTKPIKPDNLRHSLLQALADQPRAATTVKPETKFDHTLGKRNPLSILLAEDNLVNQKVALGILKRLGYTADLAKNGLAVLQAVEQQQYDVILMDIQMPEMDGLEATRHIREQLAPTQQPVIIALTANALNGDREKYLTAGMNDYVSKPIAIQKLVAVLDKYKARESAPLLM